MRGITSRSSPGPSQTWSRKRASWNSRVYDTNSSIKPNMNKRTILKPPDIAAIAYLAKAGHKPTYISETTGISLCSCERWSKAFHDNNFQDLPLPKKPPGKARKVSPRGVSILRREVEKNPRITAKQLKDQNPDILGNVSVSTVCRNLRRDLQYQWRCAWKKTYKLVVRL